MPHWSLLQRLQVHVFSAKKDVKNLPVHQRFVLSVYQHGHCVEVNFYFGRHGSVLTRKITGAPSSRYGRGSERVGIAVTGDGWDVICEIKYWGLRMKIIPYFTFWSINKLKKGDLSLMYFGVHSSKGNAIEPKSRLVVAYVRLSTTRPLPTEDPDTSTLWKRICLIAYNF